MLETIVIGRGDDTLQCIMDNPHFELCKPFSITGVDEETIDVNWGGELATSDLDIIEAYLYAKAEALTEQFEQALHSGPFDKVMPLAGQLMSITVVKRMVQDARANA